MCGRRIGWYVSTRTMDGLHILPQLPGFTLPRVSEVHVDWLVFATAFGLSILTGVLFGAVLRPADVVPGQTDVLNGIAYDAVGDRLFVTGKNWPKLFQIKLHPAPSADSR